MVQKVTKCGVHSGNTLRASHSKYTKTYRKQSCLVRTIKNSANLRILQDFGVATDDVVYSLNKKGRWALPNVLKEHILLEGFHEDGPNVQLTESHKLRKNAKCLGFYASKGPIRKAVPSKKRYFNISSVKNLKSVYSEKKEEDGENEVYENVEPEVNVEVFHPTPITSSITHNRKYIKPMQQTDFQVQTKAIKKTKRRNRALKFDTELFEEEYDYDCWGDDEEIETHHFQRPDSFFTAADILKSAAKAKKIFERGRKKSRKLSTEEINPKAKIVYVDSAPDDIDIIHEELTDRVAPTPSQRSIGHKRVLVSKKVVLSTQETQPDFLQFIYGDKYIECRTFPRTFVIDVTEDAKATLMKSIPMKYKAFLFDLKTLLIFTYDIYSACGNGEEIFDVYLNINVKADIIEPSTLLDYMNGSLESIINQALSQVRIFEENQFERIKMHSKGNNGMALDALASCWSKGKSTLSEDELFEEALKEQREMTNSIGAGFEALPPEVCFICFETMNEKRPGIAMENCGHWFCRECWREHLMNKTSSKILCPEYKCGQEVDFGTIIQFLNISEVRKYLMRRKETSVEMQQKYCPNEKCGRFLSSSLGKSHKNAACACGTKFCSRCFQSPHWPAPCDTSQQYWRMLKKKGIQIKLNDTDFSSSVPEVFVQGKACPKCNRFIEKLGGCYSMSCICGASFCWGCRGIYGVNHRGSDLCNQYKHGDLYRTKKMHINDDEVDKQKMKEESVLLQAAVNHRAERAVSKATSMKRTINSLCQKFGTLGRKSITKISEMLEDIDANEKSVTSKLEHFLRNMMSLYFEMRHLAEYTAVFANHNAKFRESLKYVLERIEDLAAEIYYRIDHGADADIVSMVCGLLDIQNHCMNTVAGLVKLVTK